MTSPEYRRTDNGVEKISKYLALDERLGLDYYNYFWSEYGCRLVQHGGYTVLTSESTGSARRGGARTAAIG
ncbi:hypothetical protein D1872_302730 [compost metagenome]